MADTRAELLQGTLDLLILQTLELEAGPQHGWGIAQRIQQLSRDVLAVQQGSLYPALHRLELRGMVRSRWGSSENNRRAKYYELTAAGRRELGVVTAQWERFARAIGHLLAEATEEPT